MADKSEAPQPAPKKNLEAEIEAWFAEHFHDSIISRAGTEIYNHVHDAKEKLKARLLKALG